MNDGRADSDALANLKRAQERVNALREDGSEAADDHELVTAMNRLMSLIRHATPEDVAAFDAWRRL